MKNPLQELVSVSQYFGRDKSFVLAGGGNTSYKTEDRMWIKASGISLASIKADGFVFLSRDRLKAISTKKYSDQALAREHEVKMDLNAAILDNSTLRPSVETSLHNAIGYRFVVHTHPTIVNAMLCSVKAKEQCLSLFGEKALFIPYTDPGYILFKKVEAEINNFEKKWGEIPKVIFLENHGVFVGADSVEEIHLIYTNLIQKIENNFVDQMPSLQTIFLNKDVLKVVINSHRGFEGLIAMGFKSDLVDLFVSDKKSFEKVEKSFTPDDIVYCKAYYLFVQKIELLKESVEEYHRSYGYLPKVIALKNIGVFSIEENEKSARTVWEVFENILKISFYSENFGGPHFLNERQIAFIDNWEVENYRREMNKV
ncbi:MAG: class II aldolase/adducin family protein [Bacteroidia bacterium]|nr:class II aldolase/adducin family protein [Bacteroidia bacterium]